MSLNNILIKVSRIFLNIFWLFEPGCSGCCINIRTIKTKVPHITNTIHSIIKNNNHNLRVVCHQAKLVIEVDGDYHFEEQQMSEDIRRTNVLLDLGFRELRFTNHQVLTDVATVVESIRQSLNTIDI